MGTGLPLCVFALEHRHQVQGEELTVAERRLSHHAFASEAEAFVEMARPGVVFKDVEKKPVCLEILEYDAGQFFENPASQPAFGCCDHDALEFHRTRVLTEPAQDGVGLQIA